MDLPRGGCKERNILLLIWLLKRGNWTAAAAAGDWTAAARHCVFLSTP